MGKASKKSGGNEGTRIFVKEVTTKRSLQLISTNLSVNQKNVVVGLSTSDESL